MDRLIVVGASAGGVAALKVLSASLPAHLPVPVLVVLHVGTHPSILPEIMSAHGALPVRHAREGEKVCAGTIYVAPPDQHMLVAGNAVRLNRGPKEHHVRPAIDPLFRSAALSYGTGAIGVVLTGRLDDGTAGLQAIKRWGGTTVVQDPADCAEPSMPLSALRHVRVDHCVPMAAMGTLLASLSSVSVSASTHEISDEVTPREQAVMLFQGDGMENLSAIAKPSPYVCPDCHGGLWEVVDSSPLRYRCHVGHAYTIRTLQHTMQSTADDALWTALRALQERGYVLKQMAGMNRAAGELSLAEAMDQEAARIDSECRELHGVIERRSVALLVE